MKFAVENPDNGIFLIDEHAQATKLSHIVENMPKRLIAMVPADIAAGVYTLEVRTTLTSAQKEAKHKALKTGYFNKELTVVVHE